MKDTIVAIATPKINSSISIIRISGKDSFNLISKLCNKDIVKKGYTFSKEYIYENDKILDEVIILKFVEPRSFTGEDVIEINCHGGILITNKILELILEYGARLAENGEFTKRAFLNNKLTLRQANSINNLIFAKTPTSLELASNGIVNNNSEFLKNIKEQLFLLIGKIEVNIDYPEYDDVEQIAINDYYKVVNDVLEKLNNLKKDYEKVNYLYKGINVAIIGKPNVGKSSLLNTILKEDRAIVSDIKGTTRDVISESILFEGLQLNIIDTAGIRRSKNKIESIGIDKTYDSIKKADLILFLIDSSKKIDKSEKEILDKIKNKNHILVKNKSDLNSDANPNIDGVKISTIKKDIKELVSEIKNKFNNNNFNLANNLSICSDNEFTIIKQIIIILKKSLKNANNNLPIDILVEDIVEVYKKICALTGETKDLDIIDKMFKNFCLGK